MSSGAQPGKASHVWLESISNCFYIPALVVFPTPRWKSQIPGPDSMWLLQRQRDGGRKGGREAKRKGGKEGVCVCV